MLYKLPKLEIMFVNDDNLDNIDAAGLKQLPVLATIDLVLFYCCRFTKIPEVLYKLPKLEILFVNDNKLDNIDADCIKQLPVCCSIVADLLRFQKRCFYYQKLRYCLSMIIS